MAYSLWTTTRRRVVIISIAVKKPDYVEIREDQVLYFWGEVPYWIIVNRAFSKILDMLIEGNTLEDIAKIYGDDGHTYVEELKHILRPLVSAGIIYKDDSENIRIPELRDYEWFCKNIKLDRLIINVTRACCLNCIHCCNINHTPLPNELSLNEIKELIEDARKVMFMKKKVICFCGGEPLLRKDVTLEAASYAKSLGYQVRLSTNGYAVDVHFARKARDIGIPVQVSVDGATELTNDKIRGKGSFRMAMKAVRTLVKEGVRTYINMCYHKANIHELRKFILLGKKLGVKTNFIPLRLIGKAKENKLQPVSLDEMIDVVAPILLHNYELQEQCEDSFLATLVAIVRLRPKFRYCGVGATDALVDSNGDVYCCSSAPSYPELCVGNIRDKPFSKIWSTNPKLMELRKICVDNLNAECSSCTFRYLCGGGCRIETWVNTGNINAPDIKCEAIKKSFVKIMWLLSEDPKLFDFAAERLRRNIEDNLFFTASQVIDI